MNDQCLYSLAKEVGLRLQSPLGEPEAGDPLLDELASLERPDRARIRAFKDGMFAAQDNGRCPQANLDAAQHDIDRAEHDLALHPRPYGTADLAVWHARGVMFESYRRLRDPGATPLLPYAEFSPCEVRFGPFRMRGYAEFPMHEFPMHGVRYAPAFAPPPGDTDADADALDASFGAVTLREWIIGGLICGACTVLAMVLLRLIFWLVAR